MNASTDLNPDPEKGHAPQDNIDSLNFKCAVLEVELLRTGGLWFVFFARITMVMALVFRLLIEEMEDTTGTTTLELYASFFWVMGWELARLTGRVVLYGREEKIDATVYHDRFVHRVICFQANLYVWMLYFGIMWMSRVWYAWHLEGIGMGLATFWMIFSNVYHWWCPVPLAVSIFQLARMRADAQNIQKMADPERVSRMDVQRLLRAKFLLYLGRTLAAIALIRYFCPRTPLECFLSIPLVTFKYLIPVLFAPLYCVDADAWLVPLVVVVGIGITDGDFYSNSA
ncbi:hypothetical protein D9756_008446 [Leucocoprinus leucothites]|uniref:Uncharacterized protein n=1 Tax=Leucocoprinus leucothites TaxID=201217 RepID=A0A8H5D301_9AGAR|nr:hypothetical protein D9756_008446 [Leucoagaricus leucothites]